MTSTAFRRLLAFASMQVTWFACVLGAAHDRPWLGPAVAVVILTVHVSRQSRRAREVALLAVAALVGFAVDTLLIRAGIERVPGWTVAPVWLVALWPNLFAATADGGLLDVLPRRPLLAALLGVVGGPLAYDGGARLGAMALAPERVLALGSLGLAWGLVLPALCRLRATTR